MHWCAHAIGILYGDDAEPCVYFCPYECARVCTPYNRTCMRRVFVCYFSFVPPRVRENAKRAHERATRSPQSRSSLRWKNAYSIHICFFLSSHFSYVCIGAAASTAIVADAAAAAAAVSTYAQRRCATVFLDFPMPAIYIVHCSVCCALCMLYVHMPCMCVLCCACNLCHFVHRTPMPFARAFVCVPHARDPRSATSYVLFCLSFTIYRFIFCCLTVRCSAFYFVVFFFPS